MSHFSCEMSYNQRNLLEVLCMRVALLCFTLNLYVCLLSGSCRQDRSIKSTKLAPSPLLSCASYFTAGWEKGIAALLAYLVFGLCYNMYAKQSVHFLR